MHLSNELQKRLDELHSGVRLAVTIDGILPAEYAFHMELGRSFRTEFASSKTEFSLILFEYTGIREHYFARGIFDDLDSLATVISLWVAQQKSIAEIKTEFNNLEMFEDLTFTHPNPDIDEAWTELKNRRFGYLNFWKQREWENRYLDLLTEAKQHRALINLYPFFSHDMLRFSINKDLTKTWPLSTNIIPTKYSDKVPESSGRFCVSYNDVPRGGRYFDSAKDALDFYAEKLEESEPT